MSSATPVSVELRGEFAKLKLQVEAAQETIIEAAGQDEAAVDAKVEESRKGADARAAELRDTPQQTDGGESHWQQVRSDWDRHVQRTRERMETKKEEADAHRAEKEAEWSEGDAREAIGFAASAIKEAEYEVLNAVRARKHAEALATQ
jgi:hypothetical protein